MTDAGAIDQMEKIDTTGWPARLLEVAEEIGAAAALLLVERFGGISLYIPTVQALKRDHLLVRALGLEAATQLCKARGGEHVEVPTLYYARSKKVRIVNATGSTRAIAMRYGVTESYVRRLRQGLEQDEQLPLRFTD